MVRIDTLVRHIDIANALYDAHVSAWMNDKKECGCTFTACCPDYLRLHRRCTKLEGAIEDYYYKEDI